MKAAIMVPGAGGGIWDVRDVQRPNITAGHVLVRVYASSLNRAIRRASRRRSNVFSRTLRCAPNWLTGQRPASGSPFEPAKWSASTRTCTGVF